MEKSNHRVTPEWINELGPGEIFVFGSNESGRHGKGAAKWALRWGAKHGVAEGLSGTTYALPTVGKSTPGPFRAKPLSRSEIQVYVNRFIEVARSRPDLRFLVTKVGCCLAGYHVRDIAPMFRNATGLVNVDLPEEFWEVLRKS